jgi:hypothetical protein
MDQDGNAWGYLWMQPEPEGVLFDATEPALLINQSDDDDDEEEDDIELEHDTANDKPDWEIPQII